MDCDSVIQEKQIEWFLILLLTLKVSIDTIGEQIRDVLNQLSKLIKKKIIRKKGNGVFWSIGKSDLFCHFYEQNKILWLLRTQGALPLESDKGGSDRVPWVLTLLCL